MRILTIILAGALLATTAPSAQAAEDPKTVDGVSARQLELSRRYIEIVQSDQLDAVIRELVVGEANNDASLRDLPSEDRQFMIDLITELTSDLLPRMMDSLVPVYASTFSEEELKALVDFYDTPLGRGIVEKEIASLPEQNEAMMSIMPFLFDKLAARTCARYGCDPADVRAAMAGEMAEATPPVSKK